MENMSGAKGFVFATWNAGEAQADWEQLRGVKELPDSDKEKERKAVAAIAGAKLALAADVIALQESRNFDGRKDLLALEASDFEIYRAKSKLSGNTDTSIAIRRGKFDDIENRSFVGNNCGDVAVVIATEKASGKKIAFVSGHIAGFNFDKPGGGAETGDSAVLELVSRLKEICSDCDTVFVGADMNANPDREEQQRRFDILTKAGFETLRTGLPTNYTDSVLGVKQETKERELDYVFVLHKQKKRDSFLSFFKGRVRLFSSVQKGPLELNRTSSSSDHIAMVVKVVAEREKGRISSLCHATGAWCRKQLANLTRRK